MQKLHQLQVCITREYSLLPSYVIERTESYELESMSKMERNDRFLIKVSDSIPSLSECNDFVNLPSCGAISSFIGITRDNFQGKRVLKLSYEGYVPMAERELKKLCLEATQKFSSIARIAIVHILGDCPVGAASVMIFASSPHRREAMDSVQFLIDELKARIPIWKCEVYEGDEASVWKENIEWYKGKQTRIMVKTHEKNIVHEL